MVSVQNAGAGTAHHLAGGAQTQLAERASSEIVVFGAFTLVPSKRIFRSGEAEVPLGDRAFDLLALLVRRAGEVVSKREILEHVWSGVFVDEANLRAQIAHLRTALGDDPDRPAQILNVRGRGYVFTAEVERPPAAMSESSSDRISLRQRRLLRRCQRLLGREQALDQLVGLAETCQLTTIVGPGGLGKTALAAEIAYRLSPIFRDDVRFIELGPIAAEDLVLPSIASALGYSIPVHDPLAGLVTHIGNRKVLLILDCCEHVLDEVCGVTTVLLRRNPGLRILATSREALRAEAEHVYLLQPLDTPVSKEGLSAEEASAASSVQLFMERATSRGYIGELHDTNALTLAEICRHLDGNPLAIEMAASRLATYGFTGLLGALSGRAMLAWPGRRDDARHQSLEATLDWSFHLLSPQEQRVLMRLSILNGYFDMTAARAVACLDGDDDWAVVAAVESLVDKSLLAMSTSEGHHSFRMLDVTRLYSGMKLADGAEARTVAMRHADWCADHLADLYPLAHDETILHRFAERAVGDVRAALEWCFSEDGDLTLGIRLAAHASKMLLDLSIHPECVRWCQAALDRIDPSLPVTLQGLKLQENLALSLMYTAGNHESVGDAINRGLEMAQALDERQTELHLLAGYNLYHTRRDDYQRAVVAAERFAVIAGDGNEPVERVAADWMLGATHHLLGRADLGEQLLENGFTRADTLRSRSISYFGFDQECRAAIARAQVAWLRGRPERAVGLAKQALETAAAQNHPVTLCITYLYTPWVVLWLRNLDWAEELIERLAAMAKKHQLKPYLTGSIAMRGELLLARGQVEDAVELLGGVIAPLQEGRQHIVLARAMQSYADGLARAGRILEAEELINALLRRAQGEAPSYLLPELLRTRGDVSLARGGAGLEDAETHYWSAIRQARTNGSVGWELRATTSLARLWIGQSREHEAREVLRGALSHFTEGYATPDLIEAYSLLQ